MEEKILNVIKNTFQLDEVNQSVSQKNCEKWDSLNHLNLIIELELAFDVSFEPEEIGAMKSFVDIRNILTNKI